MDWLPDSTLRHLREVADRPDLSGTRYELDEAIGRGGMGTVYRARDRELDREVALKVVRDAELDPEAAERTLREARILARLEHPGIVPVHDAGRLADGRAFYVMKLVRGRRLDEHVARGLSLPERLRLFERLCETVAFAHAHGVVHRDLKPENVMVGAFGEVLVLDWGVAKLLPEPERERPPSGGAAAGADGGTEHGTVLGTPAWMSPEQARGEVDAVDARTDVYALGAILYFLLTGEPPLGADALRRLRDPAGPRIAPPRRLNPAVSKPLDAVCRKALAPAREERYPGADELAAEVSRCLGGEPVAAHRETPLEALGRVAWKYRAPILLVAAYLAMRVLLILFGKA